MGSRGGRFDRCPFCRATLGAEPGRRACRHYVGEWIGDPDDPANGRLVCGEDTAAEFREAAERLGESVEALAEAVVAVCEAEDLDVEDLRGELRRRTSDPPSWLWALVDALDENGMSSTAAWGFFLDERLGEVLGECGGIRVSSARVETGGGTSYEVRNVWAEDKARGIEEIAGRLRAAARAADALRADLGTRPGS